MTSKSAANILVLIQFLALFQIVIGLAVLPTLMHSGDSAILDTIKDEELRSRVSNWHDREVRVASRWIIGVGVSQLFLSSIAWVAIARASSATTQNKCNPTT